MITPAAAPLLPRPADAQGETSALRAVAEEFEAIALAELMAPMFDALDTEGLGGGGAGERMFRPMLVQEYAAAMAHAGGVGLADAIYAELTRQLVMTGGEDGAAR